ncbi:FmdB family zinc ribbon protein [Tomitella fengzijianii]|uniref:Zinc ribbon domain-containing protein n=1 Tax=Tomitella fengzijianii TaxID=2597660 RepID=A0A516X4G7_9ACTN|nr:zinc ribbon domain-containing protein [Tomitella fengzijianii]QDQ97551.1 zinc ribbon domain-containing protein [Tomitella fengzijianii]
MPVYRFRCDSCGPFDASHTMAAVPDADACPECQAPSQRTITAPALGRGRSAAMGLLDATARTASEPGVVAGAPPGRRRSPGTPVSTDPRHRALPRP